MWLPVFLVIYLSRYEKVLKTFKAKFCGLSLGTYLYLGFLFLLFSLNKKITFLSQILSFRAYLRSRLIYLLGILVFALSFFFKEKLFHFISKSIQPRLLIWQGVLDGFIEKPLFGHGFGTFTLDFPAYRHLDKILGGYSNAQINHGHSLFMHYAFEQGILGLLLIFTLFYLISKKVPQALPCLALISAADTNLQAFNQFLLMGLIILPICYLEDNVKHPAPVYQKLFGKQSTPKIAQMIFRELPSSLQKPAQILLISIALLIFIPSGLAHYYYDNGHLNRAISTDPLHPLYYLMRGVNSLAENPQNSEKDLLKAAQLSPSVPYIHGALAASQLANGHLNNAEKSVNFAIKHSGNDAYWYLISSLIHKNKNQKKSQEHYQKAISIDPHLEDFLNDPSLPSYKVIGGKSSDSRIKAFYRSGKKLFLPLPYIDGENSTEISAPVN